MTYLEQLNEDHKARLNRIKAAAIPTKETTPPEPIHQNNVDDGNLQLIQRLRTEVASLRAKLSELRSSYPPKKDPPQEAQAPGELPLRDLSEPLTITMIKKTVAAYFHAEIAEMESERRNKSIVNVRQIVMYLCAKNTKKPLQYIGDRLGGRDHSTVFHAREKLTIKRQLDPELDANLTLLERHLLG